jgi:hypothetical protein
MTTCVGIGELLLLDPRNDGKPITRAALHIGQLPFLNDSHSATLRFS